MLFFILSLTYFTSMFYRYTPWKCQKTFGFLTFSGDIEMKSRREIGESRTIKSKSIINVIMVIPFRVFVYGDILSTGGGFVLLEL